MKSTTLIIMCKGRTYNLAAAITLACLSMLMLSACNVDSTDPAVVSDEVQAPPTDTDPDNPVTDDPVLPNDDITNPIPETNTGFTVDPPIYRNNSVFNRDLNDLGDFNAFYEQDGYATPTVIRMDVRVDNLIQGVCIEDDPSGCTLADVLADVDRNDSFDVEIAVHASGEGLPDDGTITNATLRQRGNFSRSGEQKSFRLRLRGDDNLWRNEDRLQLNKHPFDFTRFKNKLSFDLFRSVPHLPSLRTQFVNLWIDNGQGLEDYGVFTHVEHVGRRYVANRRLGENDNLYKTEFFQFSQIDLDKVRVDAEGKPLDEDKFADALDIENGNDHSALTSMLEAMADPERSFESILDEHFNRNNVLTWLATNLILRQADAITKNYYLYNPAGTERFYFLPWDYDGAFESEAELRNSFNNTDLAKRKFYGYARGGNNEFISRFYRMPGAHNLLVSTIEELREHYYSDEQILSLASSLQEVLRPHLSSLPDSEHLTFEETAPQRMVTVINNNHDDIINNYAVPMEPRILADPVIDDAGVLQLQWLPAYDVTASNTLSYDLIISTSPFFETDNILFSDSGIANLTDGDGLINYPVNTALFPSGVQVFARVIARASSDPQRFWQTNSNIFRLEDGTDLFGVLGVEIP